MSDNILTLNDVQRLHMQVLDEWSKMFGEYLGVNVVDCLKYESIQLLNRKVMAIEAARQKALEEAKQKEESETDNG